MIRKLSKYIFKTPFYSKSINSEDRLNYLALMLEDSLHINGNVIECGVYKGGSLLKLAHVLRHSNKILYGLDSFEGLPYGDNRIFKKGFLKADYRKVLKFTKHYENIRLMKGLFFESFEKLKQERFCFIHLDCDVYLSYMQCLKFLIPRLNKKGILFIDDYNTLEGCNKAVHQFIDKKDLTILHKKGAYYIK